MLTLSRLSICALRAYCPKPPRKHQVSTNPISWRRLRLTTKGGNRLFFKGLGSGSVGRHTARGVYEIDPNKVRQFIIPDLAGFSLKPYVSHKVTPLNFPSLKPSAYFSGDVPVTATPPEHLLPRVEKTVAHTGRKSPLLLKLFNEITKYYPDLGLKYEPFMARYLGSMEKYKRLLL